MTVAVSEDLGNAPAFPTEKTSRNSYGDIQERTTVPGLTKRKLFAAMAMNSLTKAFTESGIPDQKEITDTAQTAVLLADALLKELSK